MALNTVCQALCSFNVLIQLIYAITQEDNYYYYPYFEDEETKSHKG